MHIAGQPQYLTVQVMLILCCDKPEQQLEFLITTVHTCTHTGAACIHTCTLHSYTQIVICTLQLAHHAHGGQNNGFQLSI